MPSILIIEDNDTLRSELSESFTDANFQVYSSTDPMQGISLALQHHPDMILLDILLPGQNGLATLSRIRQDAWGKTAKVILLTNLEPNTDLIINQVTKTEPTFYLIKANWEPAGIVQKVTDLLSSSKSFQPL